jgi:2-amino-4-hydroxy-6-hydroxymethyldihydropteridine diphosphokinase
MHERAFVLRPLLDLAPDIELPGLGPASRLLGGLLEQRLERIAPDA